MDNDVYEIYYSCPVTSCQSKIHIDQSNKVETLEKNLTNAYAVIYFDKFKKWSNMLT